MPLLASLALSLVLAPSGQPKVGDTAIPFKIESVTGPRIDFHKSLKKGPVVLIFLRGFPGYQCPLCTMQIADLKRNAAGFGKTDVILVYPGAANDLKLRAEEFFRDKPLPANFHVGVDPDFKVVDSYGLRWEGPGETAYPSSFVVGRNGKIKFAKISKEHGNRAAATDLIAALGQADR